MTLFNRQFGWFKWIIGRLGPLVRLLGRVRCRLPIDFPCEVVLAVNITVKHLYLLNADMFQWEIERPDLCGDPVCLLAQGLVMPQDRSLGVRLRGDGDSRDAVLDDWARDRCHFVREHLVEEAPAVG